MKNVDVYGYLKEKAGSKNKITISMKTMSSDLENPEHKIKSALNSLVKNKFITIIKNTGDGGGSLANTYEINEIEDHSSDIETVRKLYCKFVSKRINENLDRYAFRGYLDNFRTVVNICNDFNMKYAIYIAACFHTFSENWCKDKFKSAYPPPYIITSKKNAEERYHSFIRYVHQRTETDMYIAMDTNEKIESDKYFWESVGSPTDVCTLNLLVTNGSLTQDFVNTLIKNDRKENR